MKIRTVAKDPHQLTLATYNRLGKRYLKDVAKAVPGERSRFIKLFQPGATILDVGCAGGRDSKAFAEHGFHVTGVDVSRVFLREAKKYAPEVRFVKADVRRLRFPRDSFDGIWANTVLLHLRREELPNTLKVLRRILKPGGVLHVRVKRGRGSGFLAEKLSGGGERFFTFFSKLELEGMIRSAGLRVVYSAILDDDLKRKNLKVITVWGKKPR